MKGVQVMNWFRLFTAFAMACVLVSPTVAGDFNGSKRLICATVDARDCVRGEKCFHGAEDIGAPEFLHIDFKNKSIIGPQRTTPIVMMEKDERQLLLQGKELDYAWVLALDQVSGRFSATLTNIDGAFVLFGNCTPL